MTTAAVFAHVFPRDLRAVVRPVEVDVHDGFPAVFADVLERSHETRSRVVDEDVHAAELGDGGVHEGVHGVAVGHVAFDGDRPSLAVAPLDALGDGFDVLQFARADDDVRPVVGEPLRDGLPDAARRAGHDRGFAGDAELFDGHAIPSTVD